MNKLRRGGCVRSAKRAGVMLAAGVTCAFLVSMAAAWACVTGPTMNVNPSTASPGQSVNLSGFNWNSDNPIVVHWNGLNGPVLGSFTPANGRFGSPELLVGSGTIPTDAQPGPNILVATQGSDGKLETTPVRALVEVNGLGGGPLNGVQVAPVSSGRSVGPVLSHSSTNTTGLVLLALGATGVALFVAGIATFAASRRRAVPETESTTVT